MRLEYLETGGEDFREDEGKVRQSRRFFPNYRISLGLLAVLVIFLVLHYASLDTDRGSVFSTSPMKKSNSSIGSIALVFVAHDRPEYFRESLASVLAARHVDQVDLFVSMDYPAQFEGLTRIAEDLGQGRITIWKHVMPFGFAFATSDKITHHHKLVFNRVFNVGRYDYAILLESDLVVSPDFFEFFFATGPLLHPRNRPDNLFCASAWNDNGMKNDFVLRPNGLFRTDFFPGLGWMIHKNVWLDLLESSWPARIGNYDYWLRERSPVHTYDCIVPEVSRTHHISRYGSHVNSGDQLSWYDQMAFPSPTEVMSEGGFSDEIVDQVRSMRTFEDAIVEKRLKNAFIAECNFNLPKCGLEPNTLTVIFIDLKDPLARNHFRPINQALGLFGNDHRSSHKGLLSVRLAQPENANVTLIATSMKQYWGFYE